MYIVELINWHCLISDSGIAFLQLFNPLPDDKILDWFKLKQIAVDILKCIQIEKLVLYRVENIVRKGDIVCYKQFLLFTQCFHSNIPLE